MKNTPRPFLSALLALLALAALPAESPAEDGSVSGEAPAPGTATLGLAGELVADRQWAPAALEYRRLSLEDPDHGGVWRWMAAWSYSQSPDAAVRDRALRQLDLAEDAPDARSPALEWAIPALRGEWELADGDPSAARFHFESAASAATPDGAPDDWALRAAAFAALRDNDLPRAQALLANSPHALADLSACTPVPRKRPWVGGLLGLIPGMGYAYSGEWANATRSLVLNAIFIWAMAETAHEDQWGVFACATFLEITWYSGSIYGGIDAAHRWNERRLDEAALALRGPVPLPPPDLHRLPLLSFEF